MLLLYNDRLKKDSTRELMEFVCDYVMHSYEDCWIDKVSGMASSSMYSA